MIRLNAEATAGVAAFFSLHTKLAIRQMESGRFRRREHPAPDR